MPAFTTTESAIAELTTLLNAHYGLIYVVSADEARTLAGIREAARRAARNKVVRWSVTTGLADAADGKVINAEAVNATDAVLAIRKGVEDNREAGRVYVMLDLHAQLRGEDFVLVRALRDLARDLTVSETAVVILAPDLVLPADLQKDVVVVDWPLPDPAEIEQQIAVVLSQVPPGEVQRAAPADRSAAVEACRGLTVPEVQNVLTRSLVERRCIDIEVILAAKRQIVRRTGLLDIEDTPWSLDEVGGLAAFKAWIRARQRAFSPEAAAYGLTPPRGVLLLGIPGSGKTLAARTVARELHQPLVRFDVGRLFGPHLGETEGQVRQAIKIIESVAPCVVLIDEVEKGLSRGDGDGGTSARAFGHILSWLQDRTAPVFVVATANAVAGVLPPEFLRKGRFDELFFVDLPRTAEREAILRVHLAKRGRALAETNVPQASPLHALAEHLDGFSGAEIEQVVTDAMHIAFGDGVREVASADIIAAAAATSPLSRTMHTELAALRDWAATRTRSAAGDVAEAPASAASGARRVRVPEWPSS